MNHELISILQQRKTLLEHTINEKQKALRDSLPGKLRISQNSGRIQYYHRLDPKNSNGSYIRESNQNIAIALAQKMYDEKVIKAAQNELNKLVSLLSCYDNNDMESVYTKLSEQRQRLIHPIVLSDEQYAEQWKAVSYNKKGFTAKSPEYYTVNKERVRSKSELIIANTLHYMDIPYRYEYPIELIGIGVIHPDYTVLNKRLRKEYYWEHFGMMDDPEYAQKAFSKISCYEKNGYYPGERLIMTYETKNNPLQTQLIEDKILHYLT